MILHAHLNKNKPNCDTHPDFIPLILLLYFNNAAMLQMNTDSLK